MSLFIRNNVEWNSNHFCMYYQQALETQCGVSIFSLQLQNAEVSRSAFDFSIITSGLDNITHQPQSEFWGFTAQTIKSVAYGWQCCGLIQHCWACSYIVSEDHQSVHNLWFSQCCCRFISFGKWHCIAWYKVPGILKGHGTLIFWGLSSPVVLDPPWRWRHYYPFKCWDLLVLRYGIIYWSWGVVSHLLVLRYGITSTGPKVWYHIYWS